MIESHNLESAYVVEGKTPTSYHGYGRVVCLIFGNFAYTDMQSLRHEDIKMDMEKVEINANHLIHAIGRFKMERYLVEQVI